MSIHKKSCSPHLLVHWSLILLLASLFPFCGSAQEYLASISGTVTDSSDAVIPGANVTAQNLATHFTSSAVTNERGEYTIPFVTPGTYSVTVQANGFQRAMRTGVVLHASDKNQTSFKLSVGNLTQSVQVTADTQLLDTGTAS